VTTTTEASSALLGLSPSHSAVALCLFVFFLEQVLGAPPSCSSVVRVQLAGWMWWGDAATAEVGSSGERGQQW